jgi:hypothetical protein
MLLDSGVDIEESSRDRETALMLAASKGEGQKGVKTR